MQATFTDAALHVGYLGNDMALAGSLTLDKDLAAKALQTSADALGMPLDAVARGVRRISTTKIAGAVRALTVELAHEAIIREWARLRAWLDAIPNLFLVGRNGMHRYNNQDHSMLTAKAAVDNIVSGRTDKANLWDINVDDDYLEEK